MAGPTEILDVVFKEASKDLKSNSVKDEDILKRINYICRCSNRAGVRFLLSASLAKVHKNEVDIRNPYTEIGDKSYSGRHYDEAYITDFVRKHRLPCNSTTAFLTPGFRTMNKPLTLDLVIEGRPKEMYVTAIQILDEVAQGKITAQNLLMQLTKCLIVYRDELKARLQKRLEELQSLEGNIPLSSEEIVNLIQQHLACPKSSRLPVLVVASIYEAISENLGERVLPLYAHNAADLQTGALGDVQVTIVDDDDIITSYEMKTKRVTTEDIEIALEKVLKSGKRIDNYIFITTEKIDQDVVDYAKKQYEETHGIEFVILDCIGFVRHFLHLFHRFRGTFLDLYQAFVLKAPESEVRQELKEAFLALRQASETR